jgi:hypothetical protein
MTRERWDCSVKGCAWWIGPWDEAMQADVLWLIIQHLAKHIADKKYRWKEGSKK